MVQRFTNINLNFDSLFWPLSIDRKETADPAFFKVADKFFKLSQDYNFKYTIFIIGKDLENIDVARRVKEWSDAGHEIANHSYTHDPNLGSLTKDKIEYEVKKSHDLITNCIGKEPRGFLSPSWSTSKDLTQVLIDVGYLYDTSVFPSYFQFLVLFKLMLTRKKGHKHFNPSFKMRRDKRAFFFAPTKPYFVRPGSIIKKQDDGLLIMPLPVVTPFRIPCWHTIYFPFGKKVSNWILKKALKEHEYFYYVMHPRDLIDVNNDMPKEFVSNYKDELTAFEALDFPFDKKFEYMKSALDIITSSGTKFITLGEMAKKIVSDSRRA